MAKLSHSQIDRLGDRLRGGTLTEADLRMLDEYRRSFGEAHETVVATIREQLQLQPTGRPAKSTASLVEKLHRESIRLVQVQDIAGCRVVVADVGEQESLVASLRRIFPEAAIVDRRATPSYGYRAIHIIVRISDKPVEIQTRTLLQHLWAELSEKLSDGLDPEIKYGGGSDAVKTVLRGTSERVAQFEDVEMEIVQVEKVIGDLPEDQRHQITPQLQELRARLADLKNQVREEFNRFIAAVETQKRRTV